ncbi:MAG TPA: hypothetical protein VEG64_08510 [Candidatus Sulfotelmatobacter sp.]|nr:hypothetical protein [Candidatus Sulfotelmatobacter sp.]
MFKFRKGLLVARGSARLAFWLLVPPVLAQAPAQSPMPAPAPGQALAQPRVIEVTADHDSRYRIAGMATPSITVTAGEPILLRITAIRAKTHNRDGSIHGFSLLRARDHTPVPGWDFLLQPGTQEFNVAAPAEPGEYEVVCTVICSGNHEGMHMKFTVLPNGG